uniref:Fork-head domain-containing protein n=1 Tax=Myripristis murdjan TaxID=586833 RepID=A0A667XN72_9TELE
SYSLYTSGFVTVTRKQIGRITKCSTYLAMIAVVLQEAPDHMLTFTELMDNLEPFVSGDKKAFENNIRVCLSINKCFVKIPLSSETGVCKRHSWKLDHSQITAKMVRRHFRGILHRFPELACREGTDTWSGAAEPCTALHSPEAAVQIRCEVKFTGPFSIESLLKRDSPSATASKASPPSGVPVRADQPPCSAERGTGTKRKLYVYKLLYVFKLKGPKGDHLQPTNPSMFKFDLPQ